MPNTITVRYEFSHDVARRMARCAVRQQAIFRFAPVIAVAVFLIMSWSALFEPNRDLHYWLSTILPAALLASFFGCFSLLARWFFMRQIRKSPLRNVKVTWTITPDRIFSEGADSFRNDFSWSMISRVVETPSAFLLYSGKTQFYWLPFDGFEDMPSRESFENLARSKSPRYGTKA
jgi:hypothetical protein